MNCNEKIMQGLRITCESPLRLRKWKQFSQLIRTSTIVIPMKITKTGYIFTLSQGFQRLM